MANQTGIRWAQSCAADPHDAVREFHAALNQPAIALVIFFCSREYDLAVVADEMRRLFKGVQVVGCTTAGEIGPEGYCDHSIAGAALPSGSFAAVSGRLEHLQQFELEHCQSFAHGLMQELDGSGTGANGDNSFALLLIDGLSVREEAVARTFQGALGKRPLVGGSAGDGLQFGNTYVYHDGRFHSDSAVLILVTTSLPFQPFTAQHFVVSDQRAVVTAADAAQRVVREIDGQPAATAYAALAGVDLSALEPSLFAAAPMVVVIGGVNYVRGISRLGDDGSLKFFCAIDEGVVLRIAHGGDLEGNLEQTFSGIRAAIGEPQLVVGFDCILRRLDILQRGSLERVAAELKRNRVIGFSSYGEQYRGVHVNQTFTGIAIGSAVPGSD